MRALGVFGCYLSSKTQREMKGGKLHKTLAVVRFLDSWENVDVDSFIAR